MFKIIAVTVLTILGVFLFVEGCGKLGTVEHEGTVNTVISINEVQLRKYFGIYCTNKLTTLAVPVPTQEAVDACTDTEIANFLATISGEK